MDSQMRNVALALMEELNCPRSLTVAILIRAGEWAQIAEMATVPLHYLDAASYSKAVQASDFLRKVEELDTGIDREANAIAKWEAAEAMCYKTNERLAPFLDSSLLRTERPSIDNFVLDARSLIKRWLGPLPRDLEPRFGPGATISDKSSECLIPDKLTSTPTVTSGAYFLRPLWEETAWGRVALNRGHSEPCIVRGNHFFLVPKDGKTRRSCAKGPSLNVSYQLAVGKVLRKRLRETGIDLDDGQEIHMRDACSASVDGLTASIDLSSASDCVAFNLVKLLLPPDWFDLLNSLREPVTKLPHKNGRWWRLEKFSAMGNGFTFELETLVFLALICALSPDLLPGKNVRVYGDDILVPTSHAQSVVSCLKYFGFKTNSDKTFLEGPFRESCGGDYWLGQAVRPYQLKNLPKEPHEWISLANGLSRAYHTCGVTTRRAWFKVIDQIPSAARQFGPKELGDLVIHSEHSWSTRTRNSIRYVRVWAPAEYRKVFFWGFNYDVQWASALYGVLWSNDVQGNRRLAQDQRYLVPRNGVTGYMPKWVPFS